MAISQPMSLRNSNSRRPSSVDAMTFDGIRMSDETGLWPRLADAANVEYHEHTTERILVSRKVYDQHCFDEEYDYLAEERGDVEMMKTCFQKNCRFSLFGIKNYFFGLLPVLKWLPRYEWRENLIADLVAGITCGIMHIPQSMAYAQLAGLPAVYGLYTSFFPTLFYSVLGTSAHVALGTLAIAALMTGAVRHRMVPDHLDLLSENHNATHDAILAALAPENSTNIPLERVHPIVVVTSLSFLVGVIQFIMATLKMGFLLSYLSDQLIAGFTTAVAFIILTTQIPPMFGVPKPHYNGPFFLFYTYADIIDSIRVKMNVAALIISLICMTFIYLVKTFVNDRYKAKLKVPIPVDLIVIIIVTLASYYADFQGRWGVRVVKHVPTGLPVPQFPAVKYMAEVAPDAIAMSIILFALSVSMAQIFARRHRYKIDANQELYAYGLVCFINSFFSAWPAGASLSISCVQESAGSKTQCVLAAIIIVALKGLLIQIQQLYYLWPISKIDFLIFLVSFVATIVLDVSYGLAVAVCFAALTVVFRSQRPPCLLLGNVPNTDLYTSVKRYKKSEEIPGVKIFRFDTALYYANAELFRMQMYSYIKIDFHEMREQVIQEEKQRLKDERKRLKEAAGKAKKNQKLSFIRKAMEKAIVLTAPMGLKKNGSNMEIVNAESTNGITLVAENNNSAHNRNGNCNDSNCAIITATTNGSSQLYYVMADDSNAPDARTAEANPAELNSRLKSIAHQRNPHLPHHIIIDCSGFSYVDVTGVNMLIQVYRELKEINIDLLLACCKGPVRKMFEMCSFYDEVPKSILMLTVQDAAMVALQYQKQIKTKDKLHRMGLCTISE